MCMQMTMGDRKKRAAVCCVIAAVLLEEEEKRKKRPRERWSKDWFLQRSVLPSDCHLLNELKEGGEIADFSNYLRMDDSIFQVLLRKVAPLIEKQNTVMRDAIPSHVRLIATLRFLATGRSYEDLKFSMRVSPQALGDMIIETCIAIQTALRDFIQIPQSEEDWKKVAHEFQEKWQFPHCLGAVDGKHIQIKKPANSGSRYFNYKGTFSVVLMAVVDANYEILMADVGKNGRISDGGVIKNTSFYNSLIKGELNIPPPQRLPGSNKTAPYVFISDEAFQLTDNFMKPYALSVLNNERRIYNYRLSRARRVVENFFGILVSRFAILGKPINLRPTKVNAIVLACCYLHNFLRRHSSGYVNNQHATSQISQGIELDGHVFGMRSSSSSASSTTAKVHRDTFCSYFNNEGKVEWQDKI